MENAINESETVNPGRSNKGRGKILILPRFQLIMLTINVSVMLVFAGVLWISVHNIFLDVGPAATLTTLEGRFYREFMDYQLTNLRNAIMVATLIAACVSSIVTLVISHRLAGPILRLRSYFESIGRTPGECPELTFRESDYMRDLPGTINAAIARIKSGVESEETVEKIRRIY